MCIIAAKPAGIPMPSEATLRNMWEANPDGAGFMYPTKRGKGKKAVPVVQIEKGFMSWEAFQTALKELSARVDLTATPLVMHFRITTHGGTCPELTHPFPVTGSAASLCKLRVTAPLGIAHNGIISSVSPGKGMSDTSEYVRTQLTPLTKALPRWYENADALELVRNAIGSKMAILSPEGSITTIGKFTESEGLLYSNDSYLPRCWSYRSLSAWGDAYDSQPLYSRKLMDVLDGDPEGVYLTLADGQVISTDVLAVSVDYNGKVYAWSDIMGSYAQLAGASVHTAEGLPVRYNAKHARFEDILTVDQVIAYGFDPEGSWLDDELGGLWEEFPEDDFQEDEPV